MKTPPARPRPARPDRSSRATTPAPAASPSAAASQPLYDWLRAREAGLLLHPTALPGDQGCGVFDGQVLRWLDFLQAAGLRHWQVCPLGPTGYGDSPYQCFSAFAGNPYLIDLAALVPAGLLRDAELAPLRALPRTHTDYGALHALKWPLLFTAHARWAAQGRPALPGCGPFAEFQATHATWLGDYARFRALKDHFAGRAWPEWPADLRAAARAATHPLLRELAPRLEAHAFTQYLFFGQWAAVRAAARARAITVIGDAPIFVAADSADAWAHPELFEFDADMRPLAVAGVPPDYFSADGQLWGNPLYRWANHRADGYAWWVARMRAAFALHDLVRIDHFRGFDTYWRVPWPATHAREGAWLPGPGLELFRAIRQALPDARIIAEDLGELSASARALLRATGLPGMLVLQFAFGGDAANAYLPHHATPHAVVYAGTHDNDTTLGWYRAAGERTRDHLRRYLRISGDDVAWDLIRAAYASVARLAILTLPDVLALDSAARFNTPAQAAGNWQWRCSDAAFATLAGEPARRLRELGALFAR